MITRLSIQNFALIDDLSIDFSQGLTTLTGETGAGKSIVLKALQLIFGKRADTQMIRHQSSFASVSATLFINKVVQNTLSLPSEITIKRTIDQNGKNQISLNEEIITLQYLKHVTKHIGFIHQQEDTQSLNDDMYLLLIDQNNEEKISKLKNDYLLKRSHYQDINKRIYEIEQNKKSSLAQLEFLQFQQQELKALNIKEGELAALENEVERLKNFDKLKENLVTIYQNLEEEEGVINKLERVNRALLSLSNVDPLFKDQFTKTNDSYYDLLELKSIIYEQMNDLDFDEDHFNFIQERIYQLKQIENKYQKSIGELIDYLNQITLELDLILDYDGTLDKLRKEQTRLHTVMHDSAIKLSIARQKESNTLSKQIVILLRDLDLVDAQFEIRFLNHEPYQYLEEGIDIVDFYISLNQGEPLKPFSLIASGGEKARFMLALRSIYAKNLNLSLLILDEIDTGVSGKTAALVAKKLKSLSKEMQVIIITHLPQVAAKADTHYLIDKQLIQKRMTTQVLKLSDDERIMAIAHMLSDEELTSFAIEQAKQMLSK